MIVSMFQKCQQTSPVMETLGRTFQSHAGGNGHLTVSLGDKTPQQPMHGRGKGLGTGLLPVSIETGH